MKETKTVIGYFKQNVIDALNLNIKAGTPIKFGEVNKTHIKNRHPYEYDKYLKDIDSIIAKPDYVGINPKDNSIMYVKEYKVNSEFIRVGVKVSGNNTYYAKTLHLLSSYNAEKYIDKGTLVKVDK